MLSDQTPNVDLGDDLLSTPTFSPPDVSISLSEHLELHWRQARHLLDLIIEPVLRALRNTAIHT